MSRGYLTFAQNNRVHDYLRLAYGLALSLKESQPTINDLSVAITPGMTVPDKYRSVFDEIIEIPWGDEASTSEWKLKNEWKAFRISPYDETIKVAADMLFTGNTEHWWDAISDLTNFHVCQRVFTHRDELITSDHYRKVFTANGLPNTYSDITWFRKYGEVREIFDTIESIFKNWEDWFMMMLEGTHRPSIPSTDVVFAIAFKVLETKFTNLSFPKFVHMKPELLDIGSWGYWSEYLRVDFTPDCNLYVGGYRQTLPFHYQEKSFLTDTMIEYYERKLGI